MACPYCGSGDWERHNGAFKFEEVICGIWAYYTSECHACDKVFVTKEWFTTEDYDYECMTMEEWHESE